MAIRPSKENFLNKDCTLGGNIGHKSDHFWAVGRFPKWEFDTMVLNMSKRAWWTQKAPRTIKTKGFKGLRESH